MTPKKMLQEEYSLLIEKVSKLRKAYIIETDAAVKFKLEKQIEEEEIGLKRIEENLAALRETYLRRLLDICSQIFLGGIDRKATGCDTDASLNLCEIYTALLTQSSGYENRGIGKARQAEEMLHFAEREQRRLSAVEQLNRQARLVLLGDPGSGKSTFVNFVAICFAGEYLQDSLANLSRLSAPLPNDEGEDEETAQPWEHGMLLPVRVILRDFAAEGLPAEGQPATGQDLWEFIAKTLQETPFGNYAPFLQEHLQQHGGLVLLDGLDEVPEAHARRSQIKQAVEDFARCFPKCRILVTSRIYAYQKQEWRLSGFTEAVLAPFSKGQIRRFVDRWYQHSAPLLGMRPADATGRAESLKRVIFANRNLYELAERPLLLTLMASLHVWRGGSLPEKREELYNDAVELLLDWWESHKVKNSDGQVLSLTEVLNLGREGMSGLRALIGELAYEAHAAQPELVGTADIPEDRLAGGLLRLSQYQEGMNPLTLVSYLRDRAGLLVSHGVGIYTFPHRTFQEYLAACFLTDDQNNYPDNVAELARRDPNRWREVLLLAGAKAARGAASSIWGLAEALCYRELHDPKCCAEDLWGALLAGQTLTETVNLQQINERHRPKAERIRDWLVAIIREEQPSDPPLPAVERTLAGNILARLGDPRSGVRLREDGLPDIEWCEVPAGSFLMGGDQEKDTMTLEREQPQHEVYLPSYRISRYPVTNAQYRSFITDGGYTEQWRNCWTEEGWKWREENEITEPNWAGGVFDLDNHPVVRISWYEAAAFGKWLTIRLRKVGELRAKQEIRLPSEAEWEKAARGEDGRIYPWGDDKITPELANYDEIGLGATSAVGCFPRGKSPYGCEDISGNVYEWCVDIYSHEAYKQHQPENSIFLESGSARVLRGGGWSGIAGNCRSAYRGGWRPAARGGGRGFRLVRTPL